MPRSSWKGPFVRMGLIKKVENMRNSGEDRAIKTWFRNHTITPDLVGVRCLVYNGRNFIPVNVSEEMVGRKLGEFSVTRVFRGHAGSKKAKDGSSKKN